MTRKHADGIENVCYIYTHNVINYKIVNNYYLLLHTNLLSYKILFGDNKLSQTNIKILLSHKNMSSAL